MQLLLGMTWNDFIKMLSDQVFILDKSVTDMLNHLVMTNKSWSGQIFEINNIKCLYTSNQVCFAPTKLV